MAEQERSAGVIVFRREGPGLLFLLLFKKYKTEYWDLPKGNIEKGEQPEVAAKRETAEETGISDLRFVPGFKEVLKWFYKLEGVLRFKTVTYFLAETKTREVKVSREHIRGEWFTIEGAEKVLNHKNTRELLRKAHDFLAKREKEGLSRFV